MFAHGYLGARNVISCHRFGVGKADSAKPRQCFAVVLNRLFFLAELIINISQSIENAGFFKRIAHPLNQLQSLFEVIDCCLTLAHPRVETTKGRQSNSFAVRLFDLLPQ